MQFVADENIEREVVERLRRDGHFVWFILEMSRGITNGAVLAFANQQQAFLLTADKDFGELIFREQLPAVGVLRLRFSPTMSPDEKAELVAKLVAEYGERLLGKISVLRQQDVRIRPLL